MLEAGVDATHNCSLMGHQHCGGVADVDNSIGFTEGGSTVMSG